MKKVFVLLAVVAALIVVPAVARNRLRAVYRPFSPVFLGLDLEHALPASPKTIGIAHNGGDTKEGLALVRLVSVDVVEIDVALVAGHLDVVHTPPRRIPRALRPFVYTSASLRDVWEELPEGIAVYLDLKSRSQRAAEEVAQVLDNPGGRTIYVGSSRLEPLVEIASLVEGALTLYYPRTRAGIERLLERDPLPVRGISIVPRELDAEIVRRCQEAGLFVWAGVTNDRREIASALEWGVDGIISDDLTVLAALRTSRVGG